MEIVMTIGRGIFEIYFVFAITFILVKVSEPKPEPETARLSRLVTSMQRMQQSFQALAREAKTPSEAQECRAIAVVLGDCIRLGAELKVGDGQR